MQERAGRLEAADGGTLLLDEIGLIPIEAQEKILRVVEYGSFERVGSSRPTRVDVRIIGATNADLPALARAGRFKEDMLDRLSFEVVHEHLEVVRCHPGPRPQNHGLGRDPRVQQARLQFQGLTPELD